MLAGGYGNTLLNSADLTFDRQIQQTDPIARRGVIVQSDSQPGTLISNISQSKALKSYAISNLVSTVGPDTEGWLCYGIAFAPKYDLVLLGLHDGTIRAVGKNGQVVGQTDLPTDAEIFDLAIDGEQNKVVAITRVGTLFSYSLPNLKFTARVQASDGKYPTSRFSSNDSMLLTGYNKSQLRDGNLMLPIGPPKGRSIGVQGEKVDCFIGNGFATASQAANEMGYIEWTPEYSAWTVPKEMACFSIARRLGLRSRIEGTPIKRISPLDQQESSTQYSSPEIALPTAETFRSWQALREKFGKWHFDPKNEKFCQRSRSNPPSGSTQSDVSKVANDGIVAGVNGHQFVQLDAFAPVQLGSPNDESITQPKNIRSENRKLEAYATSRTCHEPLIYAY